MVVNAVQVVCAIEGEDIAALLEPTGGRKRHDLQYARDRYIPD